MEAEDDMCNSHFYALQLLASLVDRYSEPQFRHMLNLSLSTKVVPFSCRVDSIAPHAQGENDVHDNLAAPFDTYFSSVRPVVQDQRVACHRCGNVRKNKVFCPIASCPHVFCRRCAAKLNEENGSNVFEHGCPVCNGLCCCGNKSVNCSRKIHCYRKCPATKANASTADSSAIRLPVPAMRTKYDIKLGNGTSQHALDILAGIVDERICTTVDSPCAAAAKDGENIEDAATSDDEVVRDIKKRRCDGDVALDVLQ